MKSTSGHGTEGLRVKAGEPSMSRKDQSTRGFTLAEILITVAIIAVLVSIAIPVFTGHLEKAKRTVDLTNMRAAYSAAVMESIYSRDSGQVVYYYYTGGDVVTENTGIVGYGKSSHDVREFADMLPVPASGIPNRNGHPGYIIVKMDGGAVERLMWGGAYTGENVTSKTDYDKLTQMEKLAKDLLLVDSLQDEFRNMTYAELRNLFMDSNGNIKPGYTVGYLDNKLCITIAYSTINNGSVVAGGNKTKIFVNDLFENTGYDTSLPTNETYIINSVGNTTNTIWVNLRITKDELARLTPSDPKWNQRASTAYTYVKSGGLTTPEELREVNRKKH